MVTLTSAMYATINLASVNNLLAKGWILNSFGIKYVSVCIEFKVIISTFDVLE